MNSPIKVVNLPLDGNWQALRINPEFKATGLQARGANALLISQPGDSANYYTVNQVIFCQAGHFQGRGTGHHFYVHFETDFHQLRNRWPVDLAHH